MHSTPSHSQDQAQLRLGRIPGTIGTTKRIVSPSDLGVISIALEPSQLNPRKRKASVLTPDNADAVLSSCFDISGFMKRLRTDPELVIDDGTLFATMKDYVTDSEVRKSDLRICER